MLPLTGWLNPKRTRQKSYMHFRAEIYECEQRRIHVMMPLLARLGNAL